MDNREKIVELNSVSLSNRVGYKIFENLNFSLYPGGAAFIAGSAGTGKTSLVELLIGARKPNSGAVMVFGHQVNIDNERQLRQIRQKIGAVGGIFNLIPDLSLAENLLYPLIIRGDTVFSQKAKLKQILAQFDLFSKRDEKASHLGRNHQILAMLARAVIADQPLLLIDEPFDRLNREMAAIIPDTLRRLSAAGHTIIILTADHSGLDMPNVSKYQIKGGSLQ